MKSDPAIKTTRVIAREVGAGKVNVVSHLANVVGGVAVAVQVTAGNIRL